MRGQKVDKDMSSILTNISSMTALETLRGINRSLESVQAEISSGKKVASAKENAAVWAVSAVMASDVASFKTVSDSLSLGAATVGVARSVAEKVVGTLQEIKTLIVQAQDESVDRAKYQTDIEAKTKLIESYVASAQFNGLNLLDGSGRIPAYDPLDLTVEAGNLEKMKVLASLNRTDENVESSFIEVDRQDLSTLQQVDDGADPPVVINRPAGGLAGLKTIDVESLADPAVPGSLSGAQQALDIIEGLLNTAINAAAAFGSAQNAIEGQNEFVKTLVDAMNTGIGALTDTDMEAASARLQALQVQQQLGIQSLSIANQAPQTLLSLFRQ